MYGFVVAIGVIDREYVEDIERERDFVTDRVKGLVVAIGDKLTV